MNGCRRTHYLMRAATSRRSPAARRVQVPADSVRNVEVTGFRGTRRSQRSAGAQYVLGHYSGVQHVTVGRKGCIAMQKLIVLLHRREGMSTEEFHRYWREAHAPLLLRLPDLQRLVFNYGQVSWTGEQPAFDGISEDWFESEEAVQASFKSAARQAVMNDAPKSLDMSAVEH